MAIYIKNNIQSKTNAKKANKYTCDLKATTVGYKNNKVDFIEEVYECTRNTKQSLTNKKNSSFAVKIDTYSESKLNKVLKAAKENGLTISSFTTVDFDDVLLFGVKQVSKKYDVTLVDTFTDELLATEPLYSLDKGLSTILKAIKEYADKKGTRERAIKLPRKKNRMAFNDLVVTDDWMYVNGVIVDKNSASDVSIITDTKELYIPGTLTEVILD